MNINAEFQYKPVTFLNYWAVRQVIGRDCSQKILSPSIRIVVGNFCEQSLPITCRTAQYRVSHMFMLLGISCNVSTSFFRCLTIILTVMNRDRGMQAIELQLTL